MYISSSRVEADLEPDAIELRGLLQMFSGIETEEKDLLTSNGLSCKSSSSLACGEGIRGCLDVASCIDALVNVSERHKRRSHARTGRWSGDSANDRIPGH